MILLLKAEESRRQQAQPKNAGLVKHAVAIQIWKATEGVRSAARVEVMVRFRYSCVASSTITSSYFR